MQISLGIKTDIKYYSIVVPLLLVSIMLLYGESVVYGRPRVKPALYNIELLKKLRHSYLYNNEDLSLFLNKADIIVSSIPVTVQDKDKSFSTNPHDYCSISRYAWPSNTDPSVYIIRDGETNSEWNLYDLPKLETLSSRLKYLSAAYYITHKRQYYDAFSKHLKAWFLDAETCMHPNMEYAQVHPGKNNNKGMPYGLVDVNRFTPIIESICLLQSVKRLDKKTRRGMEQWFSELLCWVLNSEQWEVESKGNNNIIASLYVVLVEMARYTGDKETMQKLSLEYKEKVLDVQIDDAGRQPAELRRTIGFGYSVSNLNSIIDFCLIMEQEKMHFYQENQNRIDSAFEYLLQFVGNHEAFPYRQDSAWEGYEDKLERNVLRLNRMEVKNRRIKFFNKEERITSGTIINYVY